MSEDRIINPEIEDLGEERLENTLRPQTLALLSAVCMQL